MDNDANDKAIFEARKSLNLKAYQLYRQEISREDAIADERFKSFISLQGLLTASIGIVLSNGIDSKLSTASQLIPLRRILFMGVAIFGIVSSITAFLGVWTSRKTTDNTILKRDILIALGLVDPVIWAPSAHGSGLAFFFGKFYSLVAIGFAALFWLAMLVSFVLIVGFDPMVGFRPSGSSHTQRTVPTFHEANSTSSAKLPDKIRTSGQIIRHVQH